MAARDELIAADRSLEEMRRRARRRLARLPLAGRACRPPTGLEADHFCRACLTGEYPIDGARGGRDRQGCASSARACRSGVTGVAEPFTYAGRRRLAGGGRRGRRPAAPRRSPRRARRGVVPSHGGYAGLFQAPAGQRRPAGRGHRLRRHEDPAAPRRRHAARRRHRLRRHVRQRRALHGRAAAASSSTTSAVGQLDPDRVAQLVEGVADGCRQAGCALLGGETAEIPALYARARRRPGRLRGRRRGARARSSTAPRGGRRRARRARLGRRALQRLLARAAPARAPRHRRRPTRPEGLLAPTRDLRARGARRCSTPCDVRALAHVTGGGIEGNLPRVLPDGLGARVDARRLAVARGVHVARRARRGAATRCAASSTAGVGMIAVVPAADVAARDRGRRGAGRAAWRIGDGARPARA